MVVKIRNSYYKCYSVRIKRDEADAAERQRRDPGARRSHALDGAAAVRFQPRGQHEQIRAQGAQQDLPDGRKERVSILCSIASLAIPFAPVSSSKGAKDDRAG